MKQVTGSNPEAPSKEMSIRLRPDGHSFPATLPAGFETADRIRCSVLTHKTVLVPAEVFERESAANYLALAGLGCTESECAVYSEPQRQQIAVMAVDRAQHRLLTEGAGDRIVYTEPVRASAENLEYVGGNSSLLLLKFPGKRNNCIQLSVSSSNTKLGKECRVNIQQPEESKAFDSFAEAFQEKVNAALGVDKKGRALRK